MVRPGRDWFGEVVVKTRTLLSGSSKVQEQTDQIYLIDLQSEGRIWIFRGLALALAPRSFRTRWTSRRSAGRHYCRHRPRRRRRLEPTAIPPEPSPRRRSWRRSFPGCARPVGSCRCWMCCCWCSSWKRNILLLGALAVVWTSVNLHASLGKVTRATRWTTSSLTPDAFILIVKREACIRYPASLACRLF